MDLLSLERISCAERTLREALDPGRPLGADDLVPLRKAVLAGRREFVSESLVVAGGAALVRLEATVDLDLQVRRVHAARPVQRRSALKELREATQRAATLRPSAAELAGSEVAEAESAARSKLLRVAETITRLVEAEIGLLDAVEAARAARAKPRAPKAVEEAVEGEVQCEPCFDVGHSREIGRLQRAAAIVASRRAEFDSAAASLVPARDFEPTPELASFHDGVRVTSQCAELEVALREWLAEPEGADAAGSDADSKRLPETARLVRALEAQIGRVDKLAGLPPPEGKPSKAEAERAAAALEEYEKRCAELDAVGVQKSLLEEARERGRTLRKALRAARRADADRIKAAEEAKLKKGKKAKGRKK